MMTLPRRLPDTLAVLRQVLQVVCTVAAGSLCVYAGETTNSVGITMVDIPAGSFVMGSCKRVGLTTAQQDENDKRAFLGQSLIPVEKAVCLAGRLTPLAADRETPQHRVNVRPFQMGKTEVTLGQFKHYLTAAQRSDLIDDDFMKYNNHGDNAPVVLVSFRETQGFMDWLNKTDGGGYRLPSEAEWEYACRAGKNNTYCGGDDIKAVAWYKNNSGGQPHEVATRRANAFGLYDMSGNGWEWVQDYFHDSYRDAPVDGSAWMAGGDQQYRVLRGGSWGSDAWHVRASLRGNLAPGDRDDYVGFRLARTVNP